MNINSARISALIATQAKEFYRDFGSIFFSFAFPLFFIITLVVTNNSNPQYKFKLGVIDEYHNALTSELIQTLSENNSIQAATIDKEKAPKMLADGEIHALVKVPQEDFQSGAGRLELVVDQRYEEFSKMVIDAITFRMKPTNAREHYFVTRPSIAAKSEFSFIFPGMLAMALLQLGLFATATPILRARERGTLRHLLLTPLTATELIFAQISLRTIVAVIQVLFFLAVGTWVLDLSAFTWLAVLSVSILGAIMLISLGYLIAGIAPSQEFGMALIMLCNFGMLFGGNIFFNTADNHLLEMISYAIPVTYLADIYRQLISQSTGNLPLWLNLVAISVWTVAAIAIATRTFKFDMRGESA